MLAYVYTQFGGPEQQRFLDIDKPVPGNDEILVEVRAAGVNPTDWKRRSGQRTDRVPTEGVIGLGREASGIVERIGPGITGFAVGDAVLGSVADEVHGSFAQFTLLDARRTVHKPPGVSFVDAAALPIAAATASDGIHQLGLRPDQLLLIVGAGGGVGVAACQIGRNLGLRVIGTASPAKQPFIESLGVIHVASGRDAADRVRQIAPSGVDGIFDLVGGDPLRELADLLADRSKLLTAGEASTAESLGGGRVTRRRSSAVLEEIVQMVASGTMNPYVTATFPLERAGEALQLVESGHARGKVVLELD